MIGPCSSASVDCDNKVKAPANRIRLAQEMRDIMLPKLKIGVSVVESCEDAEIRAVAGFARIRATCRFPRTLGEFGYGKLSITEFRI